VIIAPNPTDKSRQNPVAGKRKKIYTYNRLALRSFERSPEMARKRKNIGSKHRNIFIRHSLNRVWRNLIVIDIIVWGVWWSAAYTEGPFRPPNDIYLLIAGCVLLVLVVLAILLRSSAFVQAKTKHVLLSVPFFWVRIPYTHIESVRMVKYQDIFEKKRLSWANKRFMRPYRHQTMATINLNKYPMPEFLIKVFLPNYMFLPEGKGFLIFTKYYLEFNTEVDSRLSEIRSQSAMQPTRQDKVTEEEDVYDGYFNLFDE
jgi:hypothetical protein